jgi:hypothetical protein
VASEVHGEADLDEEEVALLAVEEARVRSGCVRDFPGVDEVRGRAMAGDGEGVSSLVL